MPGVSLWPTCRLSMLKLRLRNIPDTRFKHAGFVAHPGDKGVFHEIVSFCAQIVSSSVCLRQILHLPAAGSGRPQGFARSPVISGR